MAFYIGNNSSSSNQIFDNNGAITSNVSAELGTGRVNGFLKLGNTTLNPHSKKGI